MEHMSVCEKHWPQSVQMIRKIDGRDRPIRPVYSTPFNQPALFSLKISPEGLKLEVCYPPIEIRSRTNLHFCKMTLCLICESNSTFGMQALCLALFLLKAWSGVSETALLSANDRWMETRDDPAEYRVLEVVQTRTLLQCLTLDLVAAADAVWFVEMHRRCSLMVCLGGKFGCRKCRHADNTALPTLWVKQREGRAACWLSFQRRVDASVSFDRNWTEYVRGFGQGMTGNFWLGLDELHRLTRDNGGRPMRWEFSDWNGNLYWTENPSFSVAGPVDDYRAALATYDPARSKVSQFPVSSTWSINNQVFSTSDHNNNDVAPVNCGALRYCGWWFGYCNTFNPNGVYYSQPFPTPLTAGDSPLYYTCSGCSYPLVLEYSMKTVECMLLEYV